MNEKNVVYKRLTLDSAPREDKKKFIERINSSLDFKLKTKDIQKDFISTNLKTDEYFNNKNKNKNTLSMHSKVN